MRPRKMLAPPTSHFANSGDLALLPDPQTGIVALIVTFRFIAVRSFWTTVAVMI
jgi:hypothetical protein